MIARLVKTIRYINLSLHLKYFITLLFCVTYLIEKHFLINDILSCVYDSQTETSLLYDAVHLFAKALHDLDTSQQIDIKPLSCESTDTWPHGYSLINYMKIVSSIN